MNAVLKWSLPALFLSGAMAAAHAAGSAENDALAISGAKIGLAQAIEAAERHAGGKASKAEYERHKGQWAYDVEVVKDKQVTDVKVDAANGRVIASSVDTADQDDGQDKDD